MFAQFAIFRVLLGFPPFLLVTLGVSASAAFAAAGGWLPAACKHTVLLLPGGVCT